MKNIVRYLLILLAALVIGGGIYWTVEKPPAVLGLQSGGAEVGGDFGGRGQRTPPGGLQTLPEGSGFAGRPERGGHNDGGFGEGGASMAGLGGIFKNLAVVGLVTLLVAAIQTGWSFVTRRRKTAAQTYFQ